MRQHFCRQNVELGKVKTPCKKTTDMLSDLLSKQTLGPTHERHNDNTSGDQTLGPTLSEIQCVLR